MVQNDVVLVRNFIFKKIDTLAARSSVAQQRKGTVGGILLSMWSAQRTERRAFLAPAMLALARVRLCRSATKYIRKHHIYFIFY